MSDFPCVSYFQYFLERKGDYSFPRENSAEPDEDLVLSSDEKDSDEDSPALDNYNSMFFFYYQQFNVYLFN